MSWGVDHNIQLERGIGLWCWPYNGQLSEPLACGVGNNSVHCFEKKSVQLALGFGGKISGQQHSR